MNTPDWKDAPQWARFVAMDGDGDWYWHEIEPRWVASYDDENGQWAYSGRCTPAGTKYSPDFAPKSLQERPA